MIKTGLLSMQRIANYGSFLQAYGLKKLLEEAGCTVEFVDYQPGPPIAAAKEGSGAARKVQKALDVITSPGPLKAKMEYIRYKKNYAEQYYPLLGITEELNCHPQLDLLVIGSDEIFNCIQSNPNVGFTPELFGQNLDARRKVSYAASFGSTTRKKLETYGVDREVGQWLGELDAISVRDANSAAIVRELTGTVPQENLDPVLMYDFMGKENIPAIQPEEKYMILYGYSGRFSKEECQAVREYADRHGLKIYNIGGVNGACDRFLDVEPLEVISWFANAECVVTDTFHGTILSVITRRPFTTVIRTSGTSNFEKLSDLLHRLQLEDRQIDDLQQLESRMKKPIPYDAVFEIIEEQRTKTRNYLKEQVSLA